MLRVYAPSGAQVGFARVVTDHAAIAYLGDVFVALPYRRRGLGVWLIETVLAHPDLQGLRRFELAAADAHALYARFGFAPFRQPERQLVIERADDELYGQHAGSEQHWVQVTVSRATSPSPHARTIPCRPPRLLP